MLEGGERLEGEPEGGKVNVVRGWRAGLLWPGYTLSSLLTMNVGFMAECSANERGDACCAARRSEAGAAG
ncbi:hypothetical protein SAMN03159306_03124 [Pseudomonas sp. NFACC48-1]|nr:hypothetical protein SAMN03159424_04345 [Pseudomonas sp. NFACC05-1]SCZ23297.1 hypothetical protein SAMN03159405_01006 [Pseudomonas sp. NFACC44-2]SDA53362.1 hypothetical protein SAMN03159429_01324 [Pseudomonas sp. NFACC51]SDY07438.1 hypothetical protein SAMN03159474_04580 [Pseudomonas sp. NFACC08-1]SFH26125.1 hypothetical protein SAMN03159302_01003 [Pseudomonas sp. NFACC54]SFL35444.1 hypothetical protein SAMN03159307_02107 [Pseudomonas sp. NFACC46-3]SFT00051.1 hypothetical protein SAMN03159